MSDEIIPPNTLRLKLHIIKSKNKIARIFQITARIIAGIGTLAGIAFLAFFFALFSISGFFFYGLIFLMLVFVSAFFYTLSLRNELTGGILLVCESVAFVLYLVLFVQWTTGWDLFVTLIITIPLAISGLIYLGAWYFEKYEKENDKNSPTSSV
jgi:hypothetical protein